jgi:hypothetical protein
MKIYYLLALGCATGLNYPDSMYSATSYLSKVLPENPFLFPYMREMAIKNADDTLDYSSLFYHAEDKYSALNKYAQILHDSIPTYLTDIQKSHLKTSLNFIKNVETIDEELGNYTKYVYELLYEKLGSFLNLEPLPEKASESLIISTATNVPESAESEIVLERRLDQFPDEIFNDSLNGYYSSTKVSANFIGEYIAAYNFSLYALHELSIKEGKSIFDDFEIIPARVDTGLKVEITSTLSSNGPGATEVVLERRFKSESESILEFSDILQSSRSLFDNEDHKLQYVVGKIAHASRIVHLDPVAGAALGSVAAVGTLARNPSIFDENSDLVHALLIQSALDSGKFRKLDYVFEKKVAVARLMEIDFIASELVCSELSFEDAFNQAMKSYEFDTDKALVTRMKEIVSRNNAESRWAQSLKQIDEDGYSVYLLKRMNSLLEKGPDSKEEWGEIDRNIISLNKLSLLTGEIDAFGANGINIHDRKLDWIEQYQVKNIWTRNQTDLLQRVQRLKTVVEHISDQINILVDIVGKEIYVDASNAEDPAKFFEQNRETLKSLTYSQALAANRIYTGLLEYLANSQQNGVYNEDIVSIRNTVYGHNGNDNGGLFINATPDVVTTRAAERIRTGSKGAFGAHSLTNRFVINKPSSLSWIFKI